MENTMRNLSDLSHHSVPLGDGGEVLVLETGAIIDAEASAMLGALHSRSAGGIRGHLKVLEEKGAANFMANFYVGYGHKSIGDLGNASVFIEGVSMLAAKAVQDFPLYNGQEVSTRYVDFSQQRFVDPARTPESATLLEDLRAFYLAGIEELVRTLPERFPRNPEESEKKYEKAIKARAFDIMRSFLPAGASTNLVWVGPLRQFADRLPTLRHHPLPEVQELAAALEESLLSAFPNSFSDKRYEATEAYHELCGSRYAYFDDEGCPEFELTHDALRPERLAQYRDALSARPAKTELPFAVRECGNLEFQFLLDFGSYRDLQRHRAVIAPMPLLTSAHGFEPWYLEELPETLRARAEAFLEEHVGRVARLGLPVELAQYYLPMGFRTANRLTGDLRALVYLVELRAGSTVHATLRRRAIQIGKALEERCTSYGLILHYDQEPDRFDVKRGDQDIVLKN